MTTKTQTTKATGENLALMLAALRTIDMVSSRLAKEKIFQDMIALDRKLVEEIFAYSSNPFWNYGIRINPVHGFPKGDMEDKPRDAAPAFTWMSFCGLLEDLKSGKIVGNSNVGQREVMDFFLSICPLYQYWFAKIINQDLKIGLASKTVKKFLPGLLPDTNPMLCRVLDITDAKAIEKVHGWYFGTKYDGMRCIAVIENQKVSFFSRTSKEIWNTEQIEAELLSLGIDNAVFDGELLAENSLRKTISIVHTQKKHPEQNKLQFFVFDLIPLQHWKDEKTLPLKDRKKLLRRVLNDPESTPHIVEEVYWTITGTECFENLMTKVLTQGFEGGVVKDPNSQYEWDRSTKWLKAKPVFEGDFKIVGYDEGKGKNAGSLGALFVEGIDIEYLGVIYPKVEARVGGGFSDKERDEYWNNQKKHLGTYIQAEYKLISTAKAIPSLREPVFVRPRPDKG